MLVPPLSWIFLSNKSRQKTIGSSGRCRIHLQNIEIGRGLFFTRSGLVEATCTAFKEEAELVIQTFRALSTPSGGNVTQYTSLASKKWSGTCVKLSYSVSSKVRVEAPSFFTSRNVSQNLSWSLNSICQGIYREKAGALRLRRRSNQKMACVKWLGSRS